MIVEYFLCHLKRKPNLVDTLQHHQDELIGCAEKKTMKGKTLHDVMHCAMQTRTLCYALRRLLFPSIVNLHASLRVNERSIDSWY